MSEKRRPNGVMCYWEYERPLSDEVGGPRQRQRLWKLVESFGIDTDGYPLEPTSTSEYSDGRHQWMGWLNKEVPLGDDEDEEDTDNEPIMGRAVTVWSVESGVGLLDMNLPEFVPWLAIDFIKQIKERNDWHRFLECGYDLYLGTARAAEKIMFKD